MVLAFAPLFPFPFLFLPLWMSFFQSLTLFFYFSISLYLSFSPSLYPKVREVCEVKSIMKKVIGSDIITSMTSGPLPLSRNQINSSFFSFLCIHTMYKARLYILYAIAEPSQCISAPSMQRICAAMLSSYIGVSFFFYASTGSVK